MSRKENTTIRTYQVYIGGEPIEKYFKVAYRKALWDQYTDWCRKQDGIQFPDDRYLGGYGWDLPQGIAELREVAREPIVR